jgi:Protein of unknown function (DUF2946)
MLRQPRRLLLTGFMLLAFLLQSYATQTHIHQREDIQAATSVKLDGAAASAHGKPAPTPVNPDNCPLCQMLYGGQHVAPDALIFFLPTMAVSIIEIAEAFTPHYDAVSHSWRGRAPPQH